MTLGIHLRRSAERRAQVDALAASLASGGGGRVGLGGVLSDLNRTATVTRVPAPAAHWGFAWERGDDRSRRWWPQGITTSADHDPAEELDGRRLLITSWYSKDVDGLNKGSRISVVDLTGPRPRYRHVLLVDPVTRKDGSVDVRPLKIHAGGLVWHGNHLHVAGTARGISTFHLDDILRVGSLLDREALGVGKGSFGYRYLLPLRFTYDAFADEGSERMRYSFLSLARAEEGARMVAGEYGRKGTTHRLADFALDPATTLLRTSDDGDARPVSLATDGVEGMQGATVVGGRWYVTTSAGRFRRGSMYVGTPGRLQRHARVLPIGVEDIAYWPSRDELWSLSEYPRRRHVFAMRRSQFG